jgi:voltage-gated potassium channel
MQRAPFRVWLFRLLDFAERDTSIERFVSFGLLLLIAANVFAVIVETVPPLYDAHRAFFTNFELFSVAVFTVEYLARLWSCTVDPRYRHPVFGRLRWMLSPLGLIDLLAVLPFFLASGLDPSEGLRNSLRASRAVRLLALLRILKMGHYLEAMRTLGRVLRDNHEELLIGATVGALLLLFSSSLMYMLEGEANPTQFGSIPLAMWWGVTTLTTVGYGDAIPLTPEGKLLGGFIQVAGVLVFALPAAILAGGFTQELARRRTGRVREHCPHCGRAIHGEPES